MIHRDGDFSRILLFPPTQGARSRTWVSVLPPSSFHAALPYGPALPTVCTNFSAVAASPFFSGIVLVSNITTVIANEMFLLYIYICVCVLFSTEPVFLIGKTYLYSYDSFILHGLPGRGLAMAGVRLTGKLAISHVSHSDHLLQVNHHRRGNSSTCIMRLRTFSSHLQAGKINDKKMPGS